MSVKVEIGFTPGGASGPFFTLDDSTKGLLDNEHYVLGGELLADVTNYVRSFRISRGKSIELDRYNAGGANVVFNNDTRAFDPTYTLSPFYGQIQPKRRIRITVDDIVQFDGNIADWDIQYEPAGYSVAIAKSLDAIQELTNVALYDYFPDEELSGARVAGVLDAIGWDSTKRDLDSGSATLAGDLVADGTNAYQYLQTVAQSEVGDIFISRNGDVKFVDRFTQVTGETLQFADDGTGINYGQISALFGSELLYNNITVESSAGTSNAFSQDSIDVYGQIDLTLDTLISDEQQLDVLAAFLLEKYKEPKYRINGLSVSLTDLSPTNRADVLAVDLGDIIGITFTPSGISPAIVTYAKVIKIDEIIEPAEQTMNLGLEALSGVVITLSDSEFGKLDSGYFLGGPYSAWTLNDAIYGRLSAGMTVS